MSFSDTDRKLTVLNLRLIAAEAEKLADGVENHRLWEGDFSQAVSRLRSLLSELPPVR